MIVVYSKLNCSWCDKAKALLNDKKMAFKELVFENNDFTKEDLRKLVGEDKPLTVPQVVIYGKLIGGYEDLAQYMEEHNIYGVQN